MSRTHESTPRADGFRMPGEHEPQQAVLMAWPERRDTWREGAGPARQAFAAVAAAVNEATPVIMCVSAEQLQTARGR
jgi:agmatine deiminase